MVYDVTRVLSARTLALQGTLSLPDSIESTGVLALHVMSMGLLSGNQGDGIQILVCAYAIDTVMACMIEGVAVLYPHEGSMAITCRQLRQQGERMPPHEGNTLIVDWVPSAIVSAAGLIFWESCDNICPKGFARVQVTQCLPH